MLNVYIILTYTLISGLAGFVAGLLALAIFFRDANPEQMWFVIYVSTGGFAWPGFLSALIETRFFPSLLRFLLLLFRDKR